MGRVAGLFRRGLQAQRPARYDDIIWDLKHKDLKSETVETSWVTAI